MYSTVMMSQKKLLHDPSLKKTLLDEWSPSPEMIAKCRYVFEQKEKKGRSVRDIAQELGHRHSYVYNMYNYYVKHFIRS